ncbi:MAG: hypothetical protein ABID64_02490 [Nitrospirota bacterium]
MPGEIITSTTIPEAKQELRDIYKKDANKFEEITKEQYEEYKHDERPDSDNHLNEEKFQNGELQVLDLTYYKYLPDRKIAYRVFLQSQKGETGEDHFLITPEMA